MENLNQATKAQVSSILTVDEFNKIKNEAIKDGIWEDLTESLEGFVVPNFTGTIQVFAKNEDTGEFRTDFNFNDYIQHQLGYKQENYDDYFEVGLNFPEGTQTFDLNSDLSLPLSIIRDAKIDLVLN